MTHSAWSHITVIGLGSQGLAWAQNLRDSGYQCSCFLRANSTSEKRAKAHGLNQVRNFEKSDVLLLLIPDHAHIKFLKENENLIPKGMPILYAHGASLVEHDTLCAFPQWNHLLLAPKAIASELREAFLKGTGLGAVYSVEGAINNKSELRSNILGLAKDLGITAGPYEVTFEQETRADLLSEQTLLCGLIPYAAKNCFDILIEEGIPAELAYLEAWHEVKLIANAMSQAGPKGLFELISPHALVGAQIASQTLFDKEYHKAIKSLQSNIWSGEFFKQVNERDLDQERKSALENWQNSLLQKTFEKMKDDLIGPKKDET
ncbi:MAG: hypothetical protein K9K67_05520 [Bacteriovoracaceae bacterium]|nr:hypothetical protein [Bacteriovoracaceae bacterium]